jgi:hypothetical protein
MKLNNIGKFLIFKGINSKSIPVVLISNLNIDCPQNNVPFPTKASFKRYPENKLPKARKLNAVPIFLGNS